KSTMASLRSMRLRMRSIKNIGQVTKALEAVSASRVRKSQQAMFATRAYAAKAFNILSHLSQQPGNLTALHPLLHQHDKIESVTVVLFTSDRGLCGAYNTNALRTAMAFAKDQTAPVKFVAVGRKGRDLLLRRRFSVSAEFTNLPAYPTYADVSAIGRLLLDDYREGRADKVYLCYTRFVNALRQEPTIQQLLPLDPSTAGEAAGGVESHATLAAYSYEPAREELLNVIVPRFAQLQVYQALLESLASEHSARMAAMRSATDNAKDLLGQLQLSYNKARQLSITSDILDIVGGVEALAKSE
ncbi:MAG TPA: ATP synthase F1 subunit gamma, partial [Anaerolineales bacterium]|nr:ATP synthase F1 subunit gamma [Anaerolineales bacterium]